MEDLKAALRQAAKPRTKNTHLHSELHLLVDETRTWLGETAKTGKGSFSFYLGFFKRLGLPKVRQIIAEIKQSNVNDPKRLLWWKIKNDGKDEVL